MEWQCYLESLSRNPSFFFSKLNQSSGAHRHGVTARRLAPAERPNRAIITSRTRSITVLGLRAAVRPTLCKTDGSERMIRALQTAALSHQMKASWCIFRCNDTLGVWWESAAACGSGRCEGLERPVRHADIILWHAHTIKERHPPARRSKRQGACSCVAWLVPQRWSKEHALECPPDCLLQREPRWICAKSQSSYLVPSASPCKATQCSGLVYDQYS